MKTNRFIGFEKIGTLLLVTLIALIIAGCFSRSKPAYMIDQYTLEYAPPVVAGLDVLPESVRVERFSVNQSFNSQAMVYKPSPLRLAAYNYSRWRINPGDMVTDYLLRDLRNAHIFRAVFSYRDTESSRFVIEGGVVEFLEAVDAKDTKTILSLNISLLDTYGKEITEKILFQKQYRIQEPIREHTPEEFARGMSISMAHFSEQMVKDIHEAITARNQSSPAGPKPGSR